MYQFCVTLADGNLKPVWVAGVFAGVGVAALVGIYLSLSAPEPPAGFGEVGEVIVFGQVPSGPTPLPADRTVRLPRPQDFAFQLSSTGRGPRYIRIELEAEGMSSVVHEERFGAPMELDSLEFVLRVGDDYPDDIALVVTLEAPHTMSVTKRYPVKLVGPERRFWEASEQGPVQK